MRKGFYCGPLSNQAAQVPGGTGAAYVRPVLRIAPVAGALCFSLFFPPSLSGVWDAGRTLGPSAF